MQKLFVQIYGVLIGLLAVGGLFVMDGSYLLGFMNADMSLDIIRLVLAAVLLAVSFMSNDASLLRGVLVVVGVMYIGMGLLALVDATLWGLLPTGLTIFDMVFHLVTGVLAVGVAFWPNKHAAKA